MVKKLSAKSHRHETEPFSSKGVDLSKREIIGRYRRQFILRSKGRMNSNLPRVVEVELYPVSPVTLAENPWPAPTDMHLNCMDFAAFVESESHESNDYQ